MVKSKLLFIIILASISALISGCTKEVVPDLTTMYRLLPNTAISSATELTLASDQVGFWTIDTIIEKYDELPQVVHEIAYDLSVDRIKESGMSTHYDMDLDLVNNTIYITDSLTTKLVHANDCLDFYNSEVFQPIYTIPFNMPEVSLTYNNESFVYACSSSLYYPSFNHTIINRPYDSCEELETINYIPINITTTNTLNIDFDQHPDSITQTIKFVETNVSYTRPIEDNQLIVPSEEGEYEITVNCVWNEDNISRYYGHINYMFYMEIDSEPIITITSENTTPGEIVVVKADYLNDDETIMIHSNFADVSGIPLENGHAFGIIPIPCYATPDTYTLTIDLVKDDVIISQTELPFEIYDKEFIVSLLYVTESTAAIKTDDNAAKDQIYFDQARANPIQTPLFAGPFMQPVQGRISTEYGVIRVTNDDYSHSRRHYGLDIANELGTEIAATNSGLVTLSRELIITGNTIIIDHGMGLFSMYYHLDELLIEQDTMVEKGDIIAKMGTTGYSTGSHLHFGMWMDGVYLNPWSFFENDYLTRYISY